MTDKEDKTTNLDGTPNLMIGNSFWKARSSHGANPKFKDGESLLNACNEYFEWVEANPLYESKAFAFQGVITTTQLPKMRAMTLGALCLFLNVTQVTWREWDKKRNDLSSIITQVEEMIKQQKFSGAAADLLNANIIARDLGLTDKTDNKNENTVNVTVTSFKRDKE